MRWPSPRHTKIASVIAAVIAGFIAFPACDAILIGDLHIGVCNEGDKRCTSDNTLQTCDKIGQWTLEAPCVGKTCNPVTRECAGECAPGDKRCGGETPETCNTEGHWAGGMTCVVTGKHCSGGACVVTCTPGDLRCSGENTPQICDANGDWGNNGSPCIPCTGCDPGTGKCRTAPRPDGSSCEDPSNKCLRVGACHGGVCTALPDGGQVECVAAGPCSPGVCDPSTGTCAAMEGAACDDGDPCTTSSTCHGGVCTGTPESDHALAHWDPKMADPSNFASRFTWTQNVVFDKVSGLTWQRRVTSASYIWSDAKLYCNCLNGAPSAVFCDNDRMPEYPSGWRLPTRIELASITDYSQPLSSIVPAAFPGTPVNLFWSSSFPNNMADTAWQILSYDGSSYAGYTKLPGNVRCVR